MIAMDTSVLIEAVGAGGAVAAGLRDALETGERIVLPTLVLYEWLRGPRLSQELELRSELFPDDELLAFGGREAALAATLYQQVSRPRGREIDLAVAACALSWNASVWTLNTKDFRDIPGIVLYVG